MTPFIRLRDIGVSFNSPVPATVLSGINLDIERGQTVALVGPSGAGKTTLASVIGALLPPTTGSYHYHDAEVTGLSPRSLSRFRERHLGFVFQNSHLIDERTVIQNVAMGLRAGAASRSERRELCMNALERVGVGALSERFARDLSGGERHRVAIARATVKNPEVLIADEPTAALDQDTGAAVLSLLVDLASGGATVIIVSHDLRAVAMTEVTVHVEDGRKC